MAKRILKEEEYENWVVFQKEAENSLSNREHKLQHSYKKIENQFHLIGKKTLFFTLIIKITYFSDIGHFQMTHPRERITDLCCL